MLERPYTIGELARAGEVPVSTVRYYERSGLLSPEGRSPGKYRCYTDSSLERLRFIRAAQSNGFTLDDVRSLLQFQDGVVEPCKEVQSLIEARLRDLEERLTQIRTVRSVLRSSLQSCQAGGLSGRCKVLEGLAAGRAVPGGKRRRRQPRARGR